MLAGVSRVICNIQIKAKGTGDKTLMVHTHICTSCTRLNVRFPDHHKSCVCHGVLQNSKAALSTCLSVVLAVSKAD